MTHRAHQRVQGAQGSSAELPTATVTSGLLFCDRKECGERVAEHSRVLLTPKRFAEARICREQRYCLNGAKSNLFELSLGREGE
jgi:hypothetical protein